MAFASIPSDAVFVFEYSSPDLQPSLNVGLKIMDVTTGSPVQVGSIVAMTHLFNGTYYGAFSSPVAGKSYIAIRAVYTDNTFSTPDSGYSDASDSFCVNSYTASSLSTILSDLASLAGFSTAEIVSILETIQGTGFSSSNSLVSLTSLVNEAISAADNASSNVESVLTQVSGYSTTDLASILSSIQGVGFGSGDSLTGLAELIGESITAANSAAVSAAAASAAVASKASQSSVNALQTSVNAIPTNPVLATDSRIANIDTTISSRASQSSFNSILGVSFNPTNNSLQAITNAILAINPGDATLAMQENILAQFSSVAQQSSLNSAIALLNAIPTNPVLVTDSRLTYLDIAVSSRASSVQAMQIMGGGFDSSTDSLVAIATNQQPPADLSTVLSILANIQGSGFVSGVDDLVSIRQDIDTKTAQIYQTVQTLLDTGIPT